MRRRWMSFWGVALFLVNPGLACVGEDEFEYGDKEMRQAIEGTWQASLTFADSRQSTVTFTLTQGTGTAATARMQETQGRSGRSLVRTASACGNRQFVRNAAACTSSSSMPLQGSFVAGDEAYRDALIKGSFSVWGVSFHAGQVQLQLGSSAGLQFNISPNGQATNVVLTHPTSQTPMAGTTALLTRLIL